MDQQKVISKGVTLQCESSRVEEKHILDTDYADDMALLDNTGEGLQEQHRGGATGNHRPPMQIQRICGT